MENVRGKMDDGMEKPCILQCHPGCNERSLIMENVRRVMESKNFFLSSVNPEHQ
jgi:hypothetical protein